MRVSDLLSTVARWLESPDCEILLLAEDDLNCLNSVAKTCITAADILKRGAIEAEALEPKEEPQLTPEALDHLNQIITAFDQSNDVDLQKTAFVIDELLLTIAAPPKWASTYKEAQENRLDVLKDKYEETKKQLDIMNKVKESATGIDKSPMTKQYRIMEAPLSTRTCPDHAGGLLARVGENMWQCQMDKKVYNWNTGFTNERGEKVPGGDVANQTPMSHPIPHAIFDTREDRLTGYTPNKR
jgi:hypothetical protein